MRKVTNREASFMNLKILINVDLRFNLKLKHILLTYNYSLIAIE